MNIDINDWYLWVISAIWRLYEDEISNDKEIIVDFESDTLFWFEEDLKWLRNLWIINRDNILNNKRFTLTKGYLDRDLKIENLNFDDIKELLKKIKEQVKDWKWLYRFFKDKMNIKIPDEIRFHNCKDLDILSIVSHYWLDMINKAIWNSINNKKIVVKNYYIGENELIINDWERKITLWNTESLILDKIIKSSIRWEKLYIENLTNNSANPEAVIKKIKRKIKDSNIEWLYISIRRNRYRDEKQILLLTKDT